MTMLRCLSLATIAATLLSGCGETTSDRALSGGAIGAGSGALGAAALGGNAGTGALVGGAVGAATGGLTRSDQVNLGRPVWRR